MTTCEYFPDIIMLYCIGMLNNIGDNIAAVCDRRISTVLQRSVLWLKMDMENLGAETCILAFNIGLCLLMFSTLQELHLKNIQ